MSEEFGNATMTMALDKYRDLQAAKAERDILRIQLKAMTEKADEASTIIREYDEMKEDMPILRQKLHVAETEIISKKMEIMVLKKRVDDATTPAPPAIGVAGKPKVSRIR